MERHTCKTMKTIHPRAVTSLQILAVALPVALIAGCAEPHMSKSSHTIPYPVAAKTNQVDDYHGTRVADPYRWLEDDNSTATKEWVDSENKVTFDFLDKIPQRAAIKQRLTELWNYERFGTPSREGGRYFISHNDGLQNQSVLYTMNSPEAEPKLLLDPNKLSADGTVALAGTHISWNGNLMAYSLSRAGSDWQELRVRDVNTGQDLADEIHWVKFSGASWSKDNAGFYYSRYDEPKTGDSLKGVNYFQKMYYHKLGTAQADDKLIYERKDHKDWGIGGDVTDDGHFLIIQLSQGTDTRNRVFYRDLEGPDSPV